MNAVKTINCTCVIETTNVITNSTITIDVEVSNVINIHTTIRIDKIELENQI